jgi:hypothetical protein
MRALAPTQAPVLKRKLSVGSESGSAGEGRFSLRSSRPCVPQDALWLSI